MDEKKKLAAIESYLKELFPECAIENRWDSKSRRYIFRVNTASGETKHTVGIFHEFIRNNEPEDIVTSLILDNLKGYLQIFGSKEVLVTDDGINPEGIRPVVIK